MKLESDLASIRPVTIMQPPQNPREDSFHRDGMDVV